MVTRLLFSSQQDGLGTEKDRLHLSGRLTPKGCAPPHLRRTHVGNRWHPPWRLATGDTSELDRHILSIYIVYIYILYMCYIIYYILYIIYYILYIIYYILYIIYDIYVEIASCVFRLVFPVMPAACTSTSMVPHWRLTCVKCLNLSE